jgi:serine/threonine-protein kinase RsbT
VIYPFAGGVRVCVTIGDASAIAVVRRHVRDLGREAKLSEVAIAALATAATEIARNIVNHAGHGEVLLGMAAEGDRRGVLLVARDDGAGIPDLARAMKDGYTTGGGLGLGLSSARRLVDVFELSSSSGAGTTVLMTKWSSSAES